MSRREEALSMHLQHKGKLGTYSKVSVKNTEDLSLAYSPGVAEPCREIYKNPKTIYDYTMKGNTIAVVSDGSAVLGLGNIGTHAGLPVMEGKSVLFKEFAGVDAFPICVDSQNVEDIIQTVKMIEPNFGGVNLEDISAPRCFEIEERLKKELDIPVFHDDQHGTAIVTVAGLINSLRLVNKKFEEIKVVVNGAGAAGIAVTKLLQHFGVADIIVCDSKGAIYKGRNKGMNPIKEKIAESTNHAGEKGNLKEVLVDTDVFIGVSIKDILTGEMVKTMAKDPIIFALANPDPEILPEKAKEAGARVICTGRSDYPNQVNNVLAFPGLFKGALKVRAKEINEDMKIAATQAIAELVSEEELSDDYVIPNPFDTRVVEAVSQAVSDQALASSTIKL
ncbi:NAD(P)-dependent malic enzyme [Gracilibacillus kekensis]|uniref:Malate dehydrogenase (Oxaloacetate-decarboxylating) n=1 Tax=Gracilibacillus kekensis TaxID=1027249 RepID=A0A1M7Q812_9BACI|nr:malic enzyme-like NAD(P)-binding protein [Gracilibacillus kekensis]SHN26755.1 malate dehydrogenase (oxaloacetate-decarboxylating) [Gracilibacillus kekensis]